MATRDKHERFVSLAEARTMKALEAVRLIGNLSNRNNYEYTEEEVDRIFKAIDGEIRTAKMRFRTASATERRRFKLAAPE